MKEHIDELHIVAKGLLEYETLTLGEMQDLLKGIQPNRDDFNDDSGNTTKTAPSVPKTGGSATAPAS